MPVTPFDVFCAGQTVLSDGKVLVAGGTQQYDPFLGLRSSWFFDPTLEEWIRIGDMTWGRWYPTLVTLGDGRAIAVSGINQASEIYVIEFVVDAPKERISRFIRTYSRWPMARCSLREVSSAKPLSMRE